MLALNRTLVLALISAVGLATLHAQQTAVPKPASILPLMDLGPRYESRLRPNCNQVSTSLSTDPKAPGLNVVIQPGKEGYPGLGFRPNLKSWNLSPFGHIDAKVTNTGAKPITIALRVDNEGDWTKNPWNTEAIPLDPGQTDTITVIFGYSYGHKKGFDLKSDAVVNVLLFLAKSDDSQSFRVESIVAGGVAGEKPPVAPEDFRLKPPGGMMFGPGVPFDPSTQVVAPHIQASTVGSERKPALRLLFPAAKDSGTATVKLPFGAWDLHECSQVQIGLRNMGKTPLNPKVRLDSKGGATEWVTVSAPLASGAVGIITIPFKGVVPYVVGKPATGSSITSDAISGIELQVDGSPTESVVYVESIQGVVPTPAALPDWLGKRPPVAGDWVKTLDNEFDGNSLDTSVWSVYGPNYYDKISHWSKDDVILGGGLLRLRYEKKTGFQNDDPTGQKTDYSVGYLQTFDKWTQRYGYFEARMKLPKAPGLWPAFWMMPDRGNRTGDQGSRQDTANGGMEFDIMEHLTRWGGFRYNISMHYDGYGVNHKAVGSDKIYVSPDKDGFITCGLLWTPGSAIFYCNGLEVLRLENPRISNIPSYLIFTMPSGGWDNNALDDTQLPSDFIIDYVRVWQRRDLASAVDGKKPPVPGSSGKQPK